MAQVRIGTLPRSHVVLEVTGWSHPSAEDFWDGNWLVVDVTVAMGAWTGQFKAALRSNEFEQFLGDVRHLYEHLDSVAEFSTMEEWLRLRLQGDGLGHIKVIGEARDQPGIGDRLSFTADLDQTDLPALIEELRAVITAFPVRGRPPGGRK